MIGTQVLALAWEPTISGDGRYIESTLSFHDGERGFELSRLSVENEGVLLLRVKGVVLGRPENGDAQETLILIRVSIEQTIHDLQVIYRSTVTMPRLPSTFRVCPV